MTTKTILRGLARLSLGAMLLTACKTEPESTTKKADEPAPAKTTDEPAPAKTTDEPAKPAEPEPPAGSDGEPAPTDEVVAVSTGECNETQAEISKQADERAAPHGIIAHLEKNFPSMSVSWLMKESPYQKYVVETKAEKFGRCNETACYLFAAPTEVIQAAVDGAQLEGGGHDAAKLGEALGLPAANMEGPLRMMTLDLRASKSCVRLPVDEDPGVWKCQNEEDKDCFKFGGYTSGGVPELMVLDAPVAATTVREIP
ncbi:MAG: hypothetical protein KC457_01555 [Myxococcales bacterium]|nr:hypothetical protein [Myxococcales bacterium]